MVDLILYNGRIHSLDDDQNVYQAIAIKGDLVYLLGSDRDILALPCDPAHRIDIKGKTVVPGLIDSHTHFIGAAASEAGGELFIPLSVEELLEYTAKKVREVSPGSWIYFRNTYPTRLAERRYPSITELDEVAPENPVFINGAYAGQVNSCALEAAGIPRELKLPDWKMPKDERGRYTGAVLMAGGCFEKYIAPPQYSDEELTRAVLALQREYNALGITSVIEGWSSSKGIEIINELYETNKLSLRLVYTCFTDADAETDKLVDEYRNLIKTPKQIAKLGFLKIGLDGGMLTGTALMKRPYGEKGRMLGLVDPSFKGIVEYDRDEIAPFIDVALREGLQMTAHCVGDAALDLILSAYEDAHRRKGIGGRRFSVIHGNFADGEALATIRNLGLVLLTQPAWHYMDGLALSEILSPDTLRAFLSYADMEGMGVTAAAGSDHMAKHDSMLSQCPYNPFLGMFNLVTRKTREGAEVEPDQKVSRLRALQMYTKMGAYASFDEGMKGTLEEGKVADLAVLSDDFFSCAEADIINITSELTISNGRIVYRR